MRLNGGGQSWVEKALSDANAFRNEDFVVDNDGAFWRGITLPGVAVQFSHIQIFNPAASGITLFVDSFISSSSNTSGILFSYFDTELTTDIGAWFSKQRGGSAGAGRIRRENNAAQLGTVISNQRLLANTPFPINLSLPIELAAGEGFLVVSGSVNIDLLVLFTGREV